MPGSALTRVQVAVHSGGQDGLRPGNGKDETKYKVINLDTDESHGPYDTLEEAQGCIPYDKLRAYAIWHQNVRIECFDLYDDNDDRAKQGPGMANASEGR